MLNGSLLNHRRRLSSARGGGSVFFGDDGVVAGALTRGWTHPGPSGLTPDAESRRVSCSAQCPANPNPDEEEEDLPDASPNPPMVGVNSAATSSASSAAAGSSSSSSSGGGGGREQRVSSKPLPPGPLSRMDSTPPGKSEVDRILDQLTLSDETLKKIMSLMNVEMDKGLHPDTQERADIKMFPTYVRSIPDGTERGDFLALDLGGTNFRVLWVQIPPSPPARPPCASDLLKEAEEEAEPSPSIPPTDVDRPDIKMKSRIFVIPSQIMLGPGEGLFDHIVKCLAMFMVKEGLLGKSLPLGFTFSFPCKQEGLAKGRLVTWTKGFSCAGVVGEDVVQLFHDAVKRYSNTKNAKNGLEKVRCVAIVNDTTGTLMACAHKNSLCLAGLIFGTGSNACYVEKLKNVHTWDGDHDSPDEVLINTEWGAFGNGGALDFILTEFDRDVDRHSVNPSRQIFEKLISGMYMGEIARLVLCRLFSQGLLFSSCSSPTVAQSDILKTLSPTIGSSSSNPVASSSIPEVLDWNKRGTFFTKYISEIESDRSEDYHVTKQVLDECGIRNVSMRECRLVKRICETVSTRAAYLASAGTAVLLNRMERPHVTVGIDGSLYRFHPQFHNLMVKKIPDLSSCPFNLMLSEDGSGKGAALIAAVAQRIDHEL